MQCLRGVADGNDARVCRLRVIAQTEWKQGARTGIAKPAQPLSERRLQFLQECIVVKGQQLFR